MTRIDFYQLSDSSAQAPLLTTCKLVRKALKEHSHIFIVVPDQRQALDLDELLWSFDPEAFIPHVVLPRDEVTDAPVAIGMGAAPEQHAEILINLCDELPRHFQRFSRVLEMVPAHEEQREKARERYKHYKERGYALNYHQLKL